MYRLLLLLLLVGCTPQRTEPQWQLESSALSYSTIRVTENPISVMVDSVSDGKVLTYVITAESHSLKPQIADLEIIVSEDGVLGYRKDATVGLEPFKTQTIRGTYPQGVKTITIEARIRRQHELGGAK